MLALGSIIRKQYKFHCYVDDSKLYILIKPGDTNQLLKFNFMFLNSEKTVVIDFGPKN